ncbi:MAG: methyltransferase domain-containing protein [Deltaproteobacteria bacterium]|nr:methyltransferase domain-containing protein [Deltaproteobacteria bacterium]MBW2417076.1 methyltransferase domain-containing protein [Deltaproteobacteria bacterium]
MKIIDQSPGTGSDEAVRQRYSAAAQEREAALCCPVDYDREHLEALPQEVLERDYGCGDPSRYVGEGDTVLDLGSGGGKICFIASQVVGPKGYVIGVDMNREMLDLARRSAPVVAERIGYANVEFRRGRIQDLSLDADRLDAWLHENPVSGVDALAALDEEKHRLRREQPMIPDASVDIVVSNCVLNLVHEEEKTRLVHEIFRVLKRGGRIAISDIVSDEEVPAELKADPELWSGCISGAFHEKQILELLETAGFYGIAIDKWEAEPFAVVEGIEFRSVTITAKKGKEGPCLEANQAVIYRGPWKRVEDDDGHVLVRGERSAVCAKTFGILTSKPYAGDLIGIEPRLPVPEDERASFDCSRSETRHPRESKGAKYKASHKPTDGGGCC